MHKLYIVLSVISLAVRMSETRQNLDTEAVDLEALNGRLIVFNPRKYGDKHTFTVKKAEGGQGKPWVLHLEDQAGVTRPLSIQAHGYLKLVAKGYWNGLKVRKND